MVSPRHPGKVGTRFHGPPQRGRDIHNLNDMQSPVHKTGGRIGVGFDFGLPMYTKPSGIELSPCSHTVRDGWLNRNVFLTYAQAPPYTPPLPFLVWKWNKTKQKRKGQLFAFVFDPHAVLDPKVYFFVTSTQLFAIGLNRRVPHTRLYIWLVDF